MILEVKGGQVQLDEADLPLVQGYRWYLQVLPGNRPRAMAQKKLTYYYMHRVIAGAGKKQLVRHINGDGLDNRRANLKVVSRHEHCVERRAGGYGVSGYRGVSFCKRLGKWIAYIGGKHRKHIGLYGSKESAARHYNIVAYRRWRHLARLNKVEPLFPPDKRAKARKHKALLR